MSQEFSKCRRKLQWVLGSLICSGIMAFLGPPPASILGVLVIPFFGLAKASVGRPFQMIFGIYAWGGTLIIDALIFLASTDEGYGSIIETGLTSVVWITLWVIWHVLVVIHLRRTILLKQEAAQAAGATSVSQITF